jgi:hypothetical protein
MGRNAYEWILPIRNSAPTNGTSFPIDEELWEEAQQRAAQEHEHLARQQDYLRRQRMMYREELLEDSMSADHDDESVPLKTFVRHA